MIIKKKFEVNTNGFKEFIDLEMIWLLLVSKAFL